MFVAVQTSIGRRVALKVLLAGELASADELSRFHLEARAASKLSHVNVVPVYEVGEADGLQYLTMELVEGGSLIDRIKDEGPLRPQLALAIVEEVARGVAAAHAAGIIHRDLKPHNVLLTAEDTAKVMDFGLAKDVSSNAGLTVSGALLGTPAYMAPEQAGGEVVGPAADVYGIGAILYQCLTGVPPHEGATLPNLINAVLTKEPVPPRELRPALHRDVETICLKALRKEPERRYESAAALADDAARWLAGEAIEARPPTRPERLVRWARGHAVFVAICVTLILSAGVAFAYAEAFRKREAEKALEAEQEEAAALATTIAEFRGLRAAARSRAQAMAGPEDRAALDLGLGALDDEVKAVKAALDRLSSEASAGLRDRDRSPLNLGPERARLWEGLGSSLAGPHLPPPHEPPLKAREAWAEAYTLSPISPAGRRGLARLVLSREDGIADDLRRELLATPTPPLRESLRLAQGRARLAGLDLAGARASLAGLADAPASETFGAREREIAARLSAFVTALGPHRDVALGTKGDAIEARILRPGLVEVLTSSAELAGLRFRDEASEPERVRFAPSPTKARPTKFAISWPEGQPAIAARVLGKRLEVVDTAGRVTYQRSFLAQTVIDLRFVELDGDPETRELALALGPNAGDGTLVRLDARGAPVDRVGQSPRVFKLDPRGLTSPTRAPAACFLTAVAGGRGTPLVVARGAWGANDIALVSWVSSGEKRSGASPGSLRTGPRSEVGHARALAWAPLAGGGYELVAAHVEGEEPWQTDRWSAPGLSVYRVGAEGALERPPRLTVPLVGVSSEEARIHKGILGLQPLNVAGRRLVLAIFEGGSIDRPGTRRALLVDLEDGALLVNQLAPLRAWGGLLYGGDVYATGRGALVLAGSPGGRSLRIHGAPGGVALPLAPSPRALSLERARGRAVANLSGLGFGGQALDRLLATELELGASAESEALALSVLEAAYAAPEPPRGIAQPGGWLDSIGTPGVPLKPRAGWIALCRRFLRGGAERSRRGRARAQLLLARELIRSGFDALSPEALLQVEAALGEVSRDALSGAQREEFDALEARLRVRQRARRATGLSVDFAALAASRARVAPSLTTSQTAQVDRLHASDPLRVRLAGPGLMVSVTQGVEVAAGVPVSIPAAKAFRLELEFGLFGRTWNGLVEMGLLRSSEGLKPGPRLRGLTFGTRLWQAASDYRAARYQFGVGVDGPALALSPRPVTPLGSPHPFSQGIPYPHTQGGRFRVVIEHEASTRWTRFGLWRRVQQADGSWKEVLIADREGKSIGAFSPGTYLLGIWGGFSFGIDFQNQASQEADVMLVSARVDVSDRRVGLAAGGDLDPEGVAGGRIAQGRPLPAEFLQTRARGVHLWRAAHYARGGDSARAVSEVEAAFAEDPLALFRDLESSSKDVDSALGTAIRQALRRLLAKHAGASKSAHLEQRAVLHALRTEPHEALADLKRAAQLEASPGAARAELRLWVHLCVTSGRSAALRGRLPALATVQRAPRPYPTLESFWTPREGPWEGIVERGRAAATAAVGKTEGLERWIWINRGLPFSDPNQRAAWYMARARTLVSSPISFQDSLNAWGAAPKDPRYFLGAVQAYFDHRRYLEGLSLLKAVDLEVTIPFAAWKARYGKRLEWTEVETALKSR